eukprot:CAMPEP_0114308964 /NCGR_PEP_ID=MMETSP0059-20121206/18372_1 /TAXON_ID=36894 /ORGANISM="Pyramimonas parkeae, Strain CCMP726" /LENGTH=623 /DNA_ID=CAMNT_0001432707 /DNA_START=76 /DNA_END=1945 /DNA_ORIENTATION=+
MSQVCCAMILLLLALSTASTVAHLTNTCEHVSPGGRRRYVSTQQEFQEALTTSEVSCILLLNSIRLDDSSSAPEGLLFEGKGCIDTTEGKGCIRYDWPFCKHQIMTHKVVITPAPGLEPHQAELHLKGGLYYNTYLEFIGTGAVYMVGMRIFGMYDFSILDVAWAAALFAETNNQSQATSGTPELTFDQPNGFGGNVIAIDCLSFGYCGQSAKQLLAVIGSAFFSLFPGSDLETDINAGIVLLHNTSFSTSLQDEYVIDPSLSGRASHVNVSASMITRLSINITFQCCENVVCTDEDCEMSCRRPTTVEKAAPVQYEGHQYSLMVTPATRTRAQEACATQQGGRLASFESMAAYYVATRALFTTNDAYIVRQLTVWLANAQSPELTAHFQSEWVGREMETEGCVAVGIVDQLLDVVPCGGKLPYICMSPVVLLSPTSSFLPLPPSPPILNNTPGSKLDLDAMYIAIVIVAAVVLLTMCGLLMWKYTSMKPSSKPLAHISILDDPGNGKIPDFVQAQPKENEKRLPSVYELHLHNRRSSFVMVPQSLHSDLDSAQTSSAASRRLSTEENVPWLHVQEYLAQLSSTLCEAYAKSERTNGQRTISSAINHVKSDQDCKDSEECVMK